MITATAASRTETGWVRQLNEDSIVCEFPVFAVADGMGGHEQGDVASAIVQDHLERLVRRSEPIVPPAVADALEAANSEVISHAAVDKRGRLATIGSTVVGLILVTDHDTQSWLAFNVGDSRLYRLWGHEMTQLTVDHSEVQELVSAGSITRAEARSHPNRSVVTRAVGTDETLVVDYWLLAPTDGERFLLCSDGLNSELEDSTIAAILDAEPGVDAAANALVTAALSSGGNDNISVLVVDVHVSGSSGNGTDVNADTSPGRQRSSNAVIHDVPFLAEDVLPSVRLDLIDDAPAANRGPEVRPDLGAIVDDVP